MSLDLPALARAVTAHGRVVRILVTRTAGSSPRPSGTSMLVWSGGASGTIGGGALEHQAMAQAQDILRRPRAGEPAGLAPAPRASQRETFALGPALGQCCGGSVSLVWELYDAATLPAALPFARPLAPAATALSPHLAARARRLKPGAPPLEAEGWLIESPPAEATPIHIWGAGHVGRAIAAVLAPLPPFAPVLIDIAPERLPAPLPQGASARIAADPAALVPSLPQDGHHLILSHSHPLDLALCHALLSHGFASAGLIGSATKWARFRSRLAALGHPPAEIARITCPIGDPALGNHPQAIAISVAAGLVSLSAGATRTLARTGETG